jgi:hypothetical protein
MTVTARICRTTALLTAVLIAAVAAGCSVRADSGVPATRSAPVAPSDAGGPPVVLRFGDHVATATLTDTPESRQLTAMLPATVDLKDVWAQAKSGRLPHTIVAAGSTPVHDPVPGDIYFWPSTDVIAIYYADLAQAVPDPGLIRLGAIDTGLAKVANASSVRVRIELAVAAGT